MEHLLVIEEGVYTNLTRHLLGSGQHEEAGFLLGRFVGYSHGQRMVISDFIPVPEEGYDKRAELGLQVSAVFANRILKRARLETKGILLCHSHPFASDYVNFSAVDDWGEKRLLRSFAVHPEVQFAGSLVLGRSLARSRVLDRDGRFCPVAKLTVVGRKITVVESETRVGDRESNEAHARQVLAIGDRGEWLLRKLRVAVVGAGGTGSYVLDFLARLGVGNIMVIDPDLMELSNVSRVANSGPTDVGRPKVDVARDGIGRANSFARVGTIRGSVAARQVGIELAGVDLAFSCTDNLSSRAVLSQISYEFGLPVIDIGTQVVLEDGLVSRIAGKVVKIGPGFPCLWCAEDLDSARIAEENLPAEERTRLAREGYVRGLDVKEPAVVTYNATVAALASGEMLSWFLGLNRDDDRRDRLSYDGLRGTVRSVSVPRRDGCICSTALMRGLPDQIPWTSHA